MKKLITVIALLCAGFETNAQNGLENIVVETYYISDANDSIENDAVGVSVGALPVGSVTYRIYADMLPGYKFQAAYGVDISPFGGAPSAGDHELRIQTSTLFFNNEDRGAIHPTYTKAQAEDNTVMLDSWLSAGGGCAGNKGIMKIYDNGIATVVNSSGVLQNSVAAIGIPLTQEDGLLIGAPEAVTDVGISTEVLMFDSQNDGTNGPVFSTWNGSWASLNGSMGPDSADNKVLIAQITTNGVFCFELNLQIGTPSGGVENYVAQNPVGNEIMIPSLTYCSNTVGVNANTAGSASFNIFPNPTSNFILMHWGAKDNTYHNMSYTIYDVAGKAILSRMLPFTSDKESTRIDVSQLSSGLYYIALNTDGVVSVKKFIKH